MRPQFGRPKYWWCTPQSQRGGTLSLGICPVSGAFQLLHRRELHLPTEHCGRFRQGPRKPARHAGLTGGEEVHLDAVLRGDHARRYCGRRGEEGERGSVLPSLGRALHGRGQQIVEPVQFLTRASARAARFVKTSAIFFSLLPHSLLSCWLRTIQ